MWNYFVKIKLADYFRQLLNMSLSAEISSHLNPQEFDEDFFEWEERDESIPYLNHCIGKLSPVLLINHFLFESWFSCWSC